MTNENIAKLNGLSLPISTKDAVEICNFIRGKDIKKAKKELEMVIEKKLAVPLKRFNKGRAHRPGKMAAGSYPQKASKHILDLLNGVESNAQNNGLNATSLFIKEIVANQASRPWHFGRQRRRKMKRTHIKIVVEEKKAKK